MPADGPWTSSSDKEVDDNLDQLLDRGDRAGQRVDDHLEDLIRQWNQRPPATRRIELRRTAYSLKPFDTPDCKREDVLEAYVGLGKGSSRTHRIYLTPIDERREIRFLRLASKSGNTTDQRNDANVAAGRARAYRAFLKEGGTS